MTEMQVPRHRKAITRPNSPSTGQSRRKLETFARVKQSIVTLDMEGVLVPEIWIAVAEKTGIPELRAAIVRLINERRS